MTKYKIADVKAEILYGFHPVYEALRAGRRTFHEIYISKQTHTKRIERIRSAAGRKNIPLKEASPAKLETIGGAVSHQGVMARVTAYPLADTDDLLENVLSGARSPFLLLLDHIVDPHNLGAIIRTALCAGVDSVIIPKDRSASPTPAVSRISSGALEYMRVAQVNNMVRFVKTLKDQGCVDCGPGSKRRALHLSCGFNRCNRPCCRGRGKRNPTAGQKKL